MDRMTLYVRWNVLFCVLLFIMMTSAVALAELSEDAAGNEASESADINFLIINPAEIRMNAEGLLDVGLIVITKKEYEKNYQKMLENMGFGGVILDAGDRAIAKSGMTDKASELANKYDPANPDNPLYPKGGGAGDLFNQKNGIEDALAGSPFDPTVDSGRNWADSVIGKNSPTSAKGQGGTDISSKQGNSGNKGGKGFGWMRCLSDSLTPAEIGPQGDKCWVIEHNSAGGVSTEDAKMGGEAVGFATDMESQENEADRAPIKVWIENDDYKGWGWYQEGTTWWGNWGGGGNKAPVDDGSGTSSGDPNSAGYSLSGIYIEQKDNLDEVANDGGASSKINQKYKWLIDASKQPGFFVPGSGGYNVGDAGLGRDVGSVGIYDRTGLPRINTEKKIPWYLQPMALPKDMGYASEVAAASEGESRTYEFSGENMMASPEAMGGLKAGDAVKSNVVSGGIVRP